jgi:hypothetical protein
MQHPYAEPRSAERQRETGVPQVDVAHSAAGEELSIVVHVHVGSNYVLPAGFRGNIASAVQAIVFQAERPAAKKSSEGSK